MKKNFIFILLTLNSISAISQNTFQRFYRPSGSKQYSAYSITQTYDGGYAFTGGTVGNNTAEDLFVLKTTMNGDTIFSRYFGGPEYCLGSSIVSTIDSGLFVGGHTWGFFGQSNIDFYLLRLDNNGDTLWTRLISHPTGGVEYCNKVIQTSDHNLIAFGSLGTFSDDFFLNKWENTSGNLLWSKTYGGSSAEWGFDMQETSDNGLIMIGQTSSFAGTDTNICVIKTDSAGNLQWSKSYGGNNIDIGNGIRQTSDGGYILAGTSRSFSNGIPKIYLIKTNAYGDTLWTRIINTDIMPNSWFYKSVTLDVTLDNGFILCFSKYYAGLNTDIALLKTDSIGNISWFKHYGTIESEKGHSVLSTNDGGFIAAGPSGNLNPYKPLYVVKTDALGNSGCNENSDTTSWSYTNTIVTSIIPTVINTGIVKGTGTIIERGISIDSLCIGVGINELEHLNETGIVLYPNPVEQNLTIYMENIFQEECTFSVFDLNGKELIKKTDHFQKTHNLNVQILHSGLYILKCKTMNTAKFQRFIKL